MRPLAPVLMAAVCVLAATGCGGGDSGGQAAAPDRVATEAESPSGASEREPAPAIAGTSLDGRSLSLAGFLGRPVLVNVWSSW